MMHHYAFEALRDILDDRPMGGMVVLLGGDRFYLLFPIAHIKKYSEPLYD